MKTRKKHTVLAAALVAILLTVTACSTAASGETAIETGVVAGTNSESAGSTVGSETVELSISENADPHGSEDDYLYNEADVVDIAFGETISADSASVDIEGTTVTITDAGTYRLSGTLDDGALIVDAGDDAVVRLILDGVNITNPDGAAIAVMSADTAVVILADNSQNTLTDGAVYVLAEGEDEPNASLYSRSDLTITGDGAVTVFGNYNDGITGKDGLVIDSGTITVVAVDDGIRGKDYVVINGGEIDATAEGDGIKSDNEEDADRGYVLVTGGAIDVTSGDDGIQAATDTLITGGSLSITAGAGGTSDDARAIQGDVMVVISGGTIAADAADDAIHSNLDVTIDGGELTLASGDDAVHGDYHVTVNGGSILITEAFEGIESEEITINDGFIDITSSDDGLNVADADATATTGNVPGAGGPPAGGPPAGGPPVGGPPVGGPGGGADTVGDYYIYINGGVTTITVTGELAEQGDGIDANGHIEMSGGVVVVSGPTDTRNSAVDYSGGSFEVSGGMFIGTNINGRNSEGVGLGSTQASLYVTTASVMEAGTVVHIQTTDGEGLVTFVPENVYDVIVFTSPDLISGETYEIYLGGSVSGDSPTGLYTDDAYEPGSLAGTATAA